MDIELIQGNPIAFLQELVVPTSSGPRLLGEVWADFQVQAFEALAPCLVAVANGDSPPTPRFWLERTKGGSKDSDLAACLLWLLAFSQRQLRIQIAANDSEQADEIRQIIKGILKLDGDLNSLLASLIDVQATKIVNKATESTAQILTRDSKGGHGSRPDVLIVNECTHITDEEFAQTCFDNLDKMPNGLGIIATNAGFSPSWQERWKQIAVNSHRWWVQEYKQPAPWISTADLQESEQRNSRSRYRRLWWGEYSSAGGDAIDPNLIEAACTLSGPTIMPVDGFVYFAAADLGLKKDSSAIVVLGKSVGRMVEQPRSQQPARSLYARVCDELDLRDHETGERYIEPADDQHHSLWVPGDETLHLVQVQVFRPTGSEALSLSQVQRALIELNHTFRFASVFCDQWQAVLLVQQLVGMGVPAVGIDPTGPALRQQAQVVLDLFTERRIKLFREPTLMADIGRLRIEEKSYGVRLSAARSSEGEGTHHADTASAFSLACLAAHRTTGRVAGPPYGGRPLTCY